MGDELPPELNTQQKIREKLKEIEEASNRRLKSAAKKIIEQHALGDENQKKQIIEKLDKAEEELNKSGQSAVSITDPEGGGIDHENSKRIAGANNHFFG